MKKSIKIGPILLLAILFTGTFFLSGLKYGEFVTKSNLEFQNQSLQNTEAEIKVPTYPVNTFKKFEDCNLRFFYPAEKNVSKIATSTAETLLNNINSNINISCNVDTVADLLQKFESSQSAIIDDRQADIYNIDNKTSIVKILKTASESAIIIGISNTILKDVLDTINFLNR